MRCLSARDYSCKRSTQEARLAVFLQPSSLGAAPVVAVQYLGRCCSLLRQLLRLGCLSMDVPLLWLPLIVVPVPVRQCMEAIRPALGPALGLCGLQMWLLHGGSYEGTSRRSGHSRSPSRTSSRGGSASPGGGKRGSCSHPPSQSRQADEDCQEEQSSLDFVTAVSHGLPEAPSESRKIRNLVAASYKLPFGGASADILTDIDDRVSSTSSGMYSCKVSKLLQFQDVCSCKFYRFQGEDITKAKALNRHVTELAGLCTFDNLNKTYVIWSSTEAKEMEAALRSIIEATSWMDWWIFAVKSLALKSTDDARLVRRLSLAGPLPASSREDTSTLWVNVILSAGMLFLLK